MHSLKSHFFCAILALIVIPFTALGNEKYEKINSGANDEITIIQTYDCYTGITTLEALGAINVTWSPAVGLSSTTGNIVQAYVLFPTDYTAKGNPVIGQTIGLGQISGTVRVYPGPEPNPFANFGLNEWMVECFADDNFSDYMGYYIDESEGNIDTSEMWPVTGSPSDAPNYIGCPVPPDFHSYRIKRLGFPCGTYRIHIDGHDEHAELYINGRLVWNHNGCCDSHPNVWGGSLGPQSLVELRIREFTGKSYAQMTLEYVSDDFNVSIDRMYDCELERTILIGLNVESPNWSPPDHLSSTTENVVIANPPDPIMYTLSGKNMCTDEPFKDSVLVIPDPIEFGDTEFGHGFWFGYAYNGNNFNDLQGHYIEPGLSFDTENSWHPESNPSRALNYLGCPVDDDNHSYIFKRTNFPCGDYQIDIPYHDEYARLSVDGQLVWMQNSCCQSHTAVWTGPLYEFSTVELHIREFFGESRAAIDIHRIQTTTWTGLLDSDWYSPFNWSDGIPFAFTDVIIPGNVDNYPELYWYHECMNFKMEDGAMLTLLDDSHLNISGSLDVGNCIFITNKSTVELSPGCSPGGLSSSVPLDLYNLILDAGNDIVNKTPELNIRGYLDVRAHKFTTNNRLNLMSTYDETARILSLSGTADVIGNVQFNRKTLPGPAEWRLVGLPIQTATIKDFKDDFITTGFPGSHYPDWPAGNPFLSVMSYDESLYLGDEAHKDSGFVAPYGQNMPLGIGTGYRAYMSGDRLIDAKGPINKGDIDFGVTYHPSFMGFSMDGWELISNPYPCPIDWELFSGWTIHNVGNVIYFWNSWKSQYEYYVRGGISIGEAKPHIASGQGFWVQTIGPNPVLKVHEKAKVNENTPFIKSEGDGPTFVKVAVENSNDRAEFVVGFDSQSSDDYDFAFDAHYLASWDQEIPVAYTNSLDGQALAVNFFNIQSNNISIPVFVDVGVDGNYQIAVAENSLNENICLSLEDTESGSIYDLKTDTLSTYLLSDVDYSNRFIIHYTGGAVANIDSEPCLGSQTGILSAQTQVPGSVTYEWFDEGGNLVQSNLNSLGTDTLFAVAPGDYLVRTTSDLMSCGFTESPIILEGIPNPIANFDLSDYEVELGDNYPVTFINTSEMYTDVIWEFSDGSIYLDQDTVEHIFTTAGVHTVLLKVYNENCSDQIMQTVNVNDEILSLDEIDQQVVRINQIDNLLFVTLLNFDSHPDHVQIHDASGKLIYSERWINSNENAVDVSSLSTGTYIISVTKNNIPIIAKPVFIN